MTGDAVPIRRRVRGFDCGLAGDVPDRDLSSLIETLQTARGNESGVLGGRGTICLHDLPGVGPVVLKEYVHGGLLWHLLRRRYVRTSKSRPEREFEILRTARAAGVSVPVPVAFLTRGRLLYRGWLVTRLIRGRHSLADLRTLDREALAALVDRVAAEVRLLVESHIVHVDLHPGNVLIDDRGIPYLLDFDKASAFDGPADQLRKFYVQRWHRAVAKHGLPEIMSERLTRGLYGVPEWGEGR